MVVKLSAADSNRMNVAINQMDSEVFDGCVLDLADFDPTADFAAFEKDPQVASMANLFTVGMVCKFIQAKLAA